MAWLVLVLVVGWAATAGAWWAYVYRRRTDQALSPISDGWSMLLLDRDGRPVSQRKILDGSAPTRIHRGHGKQRPVWYRLTHVEGLVLTYTPER